MSHYWEEDHLRRIAQRDSKIDWRMPYGDRGIPLAEMEATVGPYRSVARDPLEVLAEALTEARRHALDPARITPDNTAQLALFENEFERVCDDCGGSGVDPGSLGEPEVCPTCKGARVVVYFLGTMFQTEEGRAA